MSDADDIVYRALTLLIFVASVFFVLFPQKIVVKKKFFNKFGPFTVVINHSIAPTIGVLLLLATRSISFERFYKGILGDDVVRPWQIIILFYSLAYLCLSLDLTGIFKWLTIKTKQRAGTSRRRLFVGFFLLAACVTTLTSNDIVILSLSPIVIYFTTSSKVSPDAYLYANFHAANTLGLALQIGNPTNVIITQGFSFPFARYFYWFVLPAITAGAAALAGLYVWFRKDLAESLPPSVNSDEEAQQAEAAIPNWPRAIFSSCWFCGCLIMSAASTWIAKYVSWVQLWSIVLVFGVILLLCDVAFDVFLWCRRRKQASAAAEVELPPIERPPPPGEADEHASKFVASSYTLTALARMPWDVLPFVLSMFIMVEALSYRGWLTWLAFAISTVCTKLGPYGSIVFMAYFSSLACCALNNQPMAILFTRMLTHSHFISAANIIQYSAMLGTVMGANFGALLVPTASLAGMLWMTVLSTHGIFRITTFHFMKIGFVVAFFVIAAACVVMCAQLAIFPRDILYG